MEFIRRNHRLTLLTLLALALLFGGCASGGIFGNRDDKTSDNGGYDNGDYDRSDNDTGDTPTLNSPMSRTALRSASAR